MISGLCRAGRMAEPEQRAVGQNRTLGLAGGS